VSDELAGSQVGIPDAVQARRPAVPREIPLGRLLLPIPAIATFFIPLDFATALFWLIALGAYLLSIILLLATAVRFVAGERRGLLLSSAGPLLAVLLLHWSGLAMTALDGKADKYARGIAQQMQEQCVARAACPEEPAGWVANASGEFHRADNVFDRYWFAYRRSEDRRSFSMYLRHRLDDRVYWTGGIGMSLQEEDSLARE